MLLVFDTVEVSSTLEGWLEPKDFIQSNDIYPNLPFGATFM